MSTIANGLGGGSPCVASVESPTNSGAGPWSPVRPARCTGRPDASMLHAGSGDRPQVVRSLRSHLRGMRGTAATVLVFLGLVAALAPAPGAQAQAPAATVSYGMAAQTVAEGSAVTVTVTLSRDPQRRVEVPLAIQSGGTAAAADHAGLPASVVFASGETRKSFQLAAFDDPDVEDSETVVLGFGTLPDGVSAGSLPTSTITITDNDAATVWAVLPGVPGTFARTLDAQLELTEGRSGFYWLLPGWRPTADVTVSVSTDLAGTDVTVTPSQLTFTRENWNVAQPVHVTVARDPDAVVDPPVVLRHTVSGGDSAGATTAEATLTIGDVSVPTVRARSLRAAESAGQIDFEVTLDAPSSTEVTVPYATSDGTATSGSDYTAASGTLTFAPLERSKTISVPVTNDATEETYEESFTLTLSQPQDASLGSGIASRELTGTIVDDDAAASLPRVAIAADSSPVTEGTSASFTLTRPGSAGPLTVAVTVSESGDAVAADDEGATTVAFGDGDATAGLTVPTDGDALAEADSEVTATLGTGTGYAPDAARSAAPVTVEDDDGLPVIHTRVDAVSLPEFAGGGLPRVCIEISGESTLPVSVQAQAADGTAAAGSDFQATSATLSSGSPCLTLQLLDDTAQEGDETFTVTLSNPVNATLGGSAATTVTILANDGTPPAPSGLRATIGRVGGEVRLDWDRPAVIDNIGRHEYRYSTSGGYGEWTALPSSGSSATTHGYANGLANGAAHTFQLRAVNGNGGESQPSASAAATPQGVVPAVTLTSTALTVPEGESRSYSVSLNVEPPPGTAQVELSIEGDSDVSVSPSTLSFGVPLQPGVVTVSTLHDADSANDTATISHTVSGYYGAAAGATAVTVIDDEATAVTPTVALTLSPASIAESGGASTVTASLDQASGVLTTLTVTAAAVAPALGSHFALGEQRTLTIPAGRTSSTGVVTIAARDDNVDGPDREVTVSAATSNTDGVLGPDAVTLTITDDDVRGVTVSAATLTAPQDGDRTYTVVLDTQPTGTVAIAVAAAGDPDVTVEPTTLSFTAATWNTPQPVTVSGAAAATVGDTATVSHTVSGGDYGANSVTAASVAVTVGETLPAAPGSVRVYVYMTGKLEVRWSSADSSSVTGFTVQWRSGDQEWDASRSDAVDPATARVQWSSAQESRRYRHPLDGLTNGTEYEVRVVASNDSGDGDPSAVATGTPQSDSTHDQAADFIENELISVHEDDNPWLRVAFDWIDAANREGDPYGVRSGIEFHLGEQFWGRVVHSCFNGAGAELHHTLWDRWSRYCHITWMYIEWDYIDVIPLITHELAHVLTLTNRLDGSPEAPLAIARLYLARVDHGCDYRPPREVLADLLMVNLFGDAGSRVSGYWRHCVARDEEEALGVVRTALAGEMPGWLADTYGDEHGDLDLALVWSHIKAEGDPSPIMRDLMRSAFGGLCRPDALWNNAIRIPWRDGGCVPTAPPDFAVIAIEDGKLTVAWAPPAATAGHGSPATGCSGSPAPRNTTRPGRRT